MSKEQETKNVVQEENNVGAENVTEEVTKKESDTKDKPKATKEDKKTTFSEEEMLEIVGRIKSDLSAEFEKKEAERESVYEQKMTALAESLAKKIDPSEAESNLKKLVPTVTAYKINEDFITSITMAVDNRTVNDKNVVVFDQQYLIKLINPETKATSERQIKIEDLSYLRTPVKCELKKTEYDQKILSVDGRPIVAVSYEIITPSGETLVVLPNAIN